MLERQKVEAWGSKYLEQVSKDLKLSFPGMQGLSTVNMKRMRMFASLCPKAIGSQPATQLPWGHLIELMFKIKSASVREWYAKQAIEQGWSRNVLNIMIKSDLHARQKEAPKISNFKQTLPALESDMVSELFKDPYNFEFLNIDKLTT